MLTIDFSFILSANLNSGVESRFPSIPVQERLVMVMMMMMMVVVAARLLGAAPLAHRRAQP